MALDVIALWPFEGKCVQFRWQKAIAIDSMPFWCIWGRNPGRFFTSGGRDPHFDWRGT
jgi:hypothetical protein